MFMRFALATIVTTLFLQSLTTSLTAANPAYQTIQSGGPTNGMAPQPATDLIKLAIEIGRQGDVQGGIAKLKDAKQIGQQTGQFGNRLVVEYLNNLTALYQMAQADQRPNLLIEATTTIDQFVSDQDFNGRGNPELAYFFMQSVRNLADITFDDDPKTYARLQQLQGGISRNLKQNPAYPADGRPFLADSVAGLATGYALENNLPAALGAISEACELGFCEFEKLADHRAWQTLNDRKALESHLRHLQNVYLENLKGWSANEIGQFESFRFPFHLDSLKGGTLSSRDFEGQILVVDLWATWCQPCREALPHLEKLSKRYRRSGVRVVGISMDNPDDPNQAVETVRNYLAENSIRFACAMGTNEIKNLLPADMKLPTTLFIDRSGTVRYLATGYQDYGKLAALTETLIDEKQPIRTGLKTVQ